MLKRFLLGTVLMAASMAYAADDEFKHFSVAISALPGVQNSTDTSVPGESAISDRAYQYQMNFINQPADFDKGPIGQKLDYFSVRAFAYKQAYTDPESTGSNADGVSRIEGIALLYGQRYLLADKGYQGFGLGWYAGFAMITDTWVQKCCGATPVAEKKGIAVAAAEIFYKFDIAANAYIEPGVTIAYDNKGTGPVNVIPALIVGGQF